MESGQYYCVTTRRFTVQCNHEEWLLKTRELYNEIVLFYFNLYLDQEEAAPGSLSGQSNQQVLRLLEVLTIVGRDRQPVLYPLPWAKIPLYFRRSAINRAITCARSRIEQMRAGIPVKRAEAFHTGVIYYKGMYRELSADHVYLKSWTGTEWRWLSCRLRGNFIPEDAVALSPTVIREEKGNALLLPVKQPVSDGRKAKQRIKEDSCICSIQFTNRDVFAAAVVLNGSGNQKAVHFFRGGSEYVNRCRKVMGCIRRSEKAMCTDGEEGTGGPYGEHINCRYWMKLKHLAEYHAHRVSREIIQFSLKNQVKIIVLPKYDERFQKCVMWKAGNWSPLHLSGRIREMIGYKAWQAGIVVLEVHASGTSATCSKCGQKVRKAGSSFECPNGHCGNRHINTARNLGRKCLEGFGRPWSM